MRDLIIRILYIFMGVVSLFGSLIFRSMTIEQGLQFTSVAMSIFACSVITIIEGMDIMGIEG